MVHEILGWLTLVIIGYVVVENLWGTSDGSSTPGQVMQDDDTCDHNIWDHDQDWMNNDEMTDPSYSYLIGNIYHHDDD